MPGNEKAREHLDFFLQHLRVERNLSGNTIGAYRKDLGKFMLFMDEKGYRLNRIDGEAITFFILYLKKMNLSPSSIVRNLSCLRSFYRFMLGHGIIRNSPLPIESPKTERPLPEILTEGEISRVLESPSETNRAYRDFAIIELLYGSGLRVSEATGIRMEDISFENETIRIKGKGNRERIAFLNRNSIEALRKYIQKRNEYAGSTDSGYLFINRSGKRLSRQSVWKMVKKINVTDKNVTPHTYRHSFATHLLQAGVDLRIVQELLGHKTLATTEIYTHVDKRQIQKVYRKFHPRA